MAEPAAITVSAPGSLMLLGEHAVLHGHRALVCAIDRRITVRLTPEDAMSSSHIKRRDAVSTIGMLRVDSALGQYGAPLNDLKEDSTFRFVLQAVRQHLDAISCGFELKIDSEFSADIGFGSSAAVTVAVHAALLKWLEGEAPDPLRLFDYALETVHAVQGRGSGSDLAASVFGGVVLYRLARDSDGHIFTTEGSEEHREVSSVNSVFSSVAVGKKTVIKNKALAVGCSKPSFDPVAVSLPLTAVYCGYKTPTPEVIRVVEERRAADPKRFEQIYAEIDAGAGAAVAALRDHDFAAFGKILNRNQELMDQMGVNTPELQEIVGRLQAEPEMFGAKISGSGLGDCAVGVGKADLSGFGYPVYSLEITPDGCEYPHQEMP